MVTKPDQQLDKARHSIEEGGGSFREAAYSLHALPKLNVCIEFLEPQNVIHQDTLLAFIRTKPFALSLLMFNYNIARALSRI
jgi:hypothetical protein